MNSTKEPIQLPEWTADDYLCSAEPYKWLCSYRDKRLVYEQLVSRAKIAAKAAGVSPKEFGKLLSAYQSEHGMAGSVQDRCTEFPNQPLILKCNEYDCSEFGVAYGVGQYETLVCRHPVMPVQRLRNIDTGEIRMELGYYRGGRWRYLTAPRSQLASSQRIVELANQGVAVDSDNAKDLVKYLTMLEDENYNDIPETASVSRLGWIPKAGFSPYVENVCYDGDADYQHIYDAVQPHGGFFDWLELAKEVRKGGMIARIQMAASFASALIEPLSCLPFFVHVWGGTEAGKTVGLMLAASVWGDPASGKLVLSFNSTNVAHERTAAFMNSIPLCLDELQVIKSRKDFDNLIYMLCEGVSKNRGTKGGGVQRALSWRNTILSTGEMPITNSSSGGGAVNRVIDIDCGDEKLFSDPRRVANTVRAHYGHAGAIFVDQLQEHMDEAETLYAQYYAALTDGESTEKQNMAAALILTADTLAERWIFGDGVTLTEEDLFPFLTSKAEVDTNRRALDWLYDWVATNALRFDPQGNSAEIYGECDDDWVYIIKSVFDDALKNEGFNPISFLAWANRKGLLRVKKPHNTIMKRIRRSGGTPIRCVCIHQNTQPTEIENVESDDLLP